MSEYSIPIGIAMFQQLSLLKGLPLLYNLVGETLVGVAICQSNERKYINSVCIFEEIFMTQFFILIIFLKIDFLLLMFCHSI